MTAWPAQVERMRAAGLPELDALLDAYQKKLFSGYTVCWVRKARAEILRAAARLGAIPEETEE